MGSASAKKTPSKKRRASTQAQTPSKSIKSSSRRQSPATAARTPQVSTPSSTFYTHALPTQEQKRSNGRRVGRSLIMWNRPRMAEKLLLHLNYESTRHKVQIPWDAIAHRLRPGSSGAAISQHLNRLRKDLIAEGHLVPPVAQKSNSGVAHDASIRGYIRADVTGEDKETTRPVKFDEKMDDPKFNLPDAFGSADESEQEPELLSENGEDNDENESEANIFDTPTPARRLPRSPSEQVHMSFTSQFKPQRLFMADDDSTSHDSIDDKSFVFDHAEAVFEPFSTPANRPTEMVDDESPDYDHTDGLPGALLPAPQISLSADMKVESPSPTPKTKAHQQAPQNNSLAHPASLSSMDQSCFGNPYGGVLYPTVYPFGPNGMMMPFPMGYPYAMPGAQLHNPFFMKPEMHDAALPSANPFLDSHSMSLCAAANFQQALNHQAQAYNPHAFNFLPSSAPQTAHTQLSESKVSCASLRSSPSTCSAETTPGAATVRLSSSFPDLKTQDAKLMTLKSSM